MKKILALVLAAAMIFAMGCGEKPAASVLSTTSQVSESVTSKETVESVSKEEEKTEEKEEPQEVEEEKGPEELIISLDYVHGEKIEKFHENLFIDVNQFDMFDGPVKVTVNVTVAKEGEYDWYAVSPITAYDDSPFYYDLSKYEVGFWGDDWGTTKDVVFDFDRNDTKMIKNMGALKIVGNGVSINAITLSGIKDPEYETLEAPKSSPVSVHGYLKVEGQGFVDEHGEEVRLTGTVLGWDYMDAQYQNSRTLSSLNKRWGANFIRISTLPHADDEMSGYTDPDANYDMIHEMLDIKIDACIEAGMYAVVDFHSYFNPLDNLDGAIAFFTHIVDKYGDCPNILYELANEPFETEEWEHVKEYARILTPIIREKAPHAVIIVPVAGWNDGVLKLVSDPLELDNVIYTYHEYAKDMWNYDRLKNVLEAGVPIFFTEFNYIASRDDKMDTKCGETWKALLDKYNCSYAYFCMASSTQSLDYSHNNGTLPTCSKRWNWDEEDMGDCMKIFYHYMRKDNGLE